jgi:membrane protease YdiL (CAAX protease family)
MLRMTSSVLVPVAASTGLRALVRRHPLASFLVLAFPLSWSIVPLTGGEGMNPTGPLLAALIVSALTGGRAQVGAWLRRSFTGRGPLRWHGVAIGVIVGLYGLAALAAFALGAAGPSADELGGWTEILFVFPLYLLLIAAPEESGWRGFLLPRLAESLGTLRATAVLGLIIAAWHTPLVVAGSQAAAVLAAIFASQFVFTWLQGRTGGSVPVVMVAHAAQGGIAGAWLGPMFTGADQTLHVAIWAALLGLAAAAVAFAARRRPSA